MSYFLDNRQFMRPKSKEYRDNYNHIFRKGKKDGEDKERNVENDTILSPSSSVVEGENKVDKQDD